MVNSTVNKNNSNLAFISGTASILSELITFPLENIKTRLQMKGSDNLLRFLSVNDCVTKTFRSVGIKGFFKGASASTLRQFLSTSIRMVTFEDLKQKINTNQHLVSGFIKNLVAGGIGGALGSIAGNFGEILKIRLINDFDGVKYKGLIDCMHQTYRTDGLMGFCLGLNINIVRAVVLSGVELSFYDSSKNVISLYFGINSNNTANHISSSIVASYFGALSTIPIDVVKTRYMNEMKNGDNGYRSSIHCAKLIITNEGFKAFYAGFYPYFMRNTLWNAIFFGFYEKLKYFSNQD